MVSDPLSSVVNLTILLGKIEVKKVIYSQADSMLDETIVVPN